MRNLHDTTALLDDSISTPSEGDPSFWYSLIDEAEAARFLGFTVRCLQGWRYHGGGPRYIKVNAKNVRYRRIDCRDFAETRLRTSTSDTAEAR